MAIITYYPTSHGCGIWLRGKYQQWRREKYVFPIPPLVQLRQRGWGTQRWKPPYFLPPPYMTLFLLLPTFHPCDWPISHGINLHLNLDLQHRTYWTLIGSNIITPLPLPPSPNTSPTRSLGNRLLTGSSPRRPLFLHVTSFDWTTKL